MSRPLVPLYVGESSGSISGLQKAITKSCTLVCVSWTKAGPEPTHQPPSWQGQGWLGAVASHPCSYSCPGLPKKKQALGTPGHGWSSWNQQKPVVPEEEAGELRTAAGRERGTRSWARGHHGMAKLPCVEPGASATGKANPTATTCPARELLQGEQNPANTSLSPGTQGGICLAAGSGRSCARPSSFLPAPRILEAGGELAFSEFLFFFLLLCFSL